MPPRAVFVWLLVVSGSGGCAAARTDGPAPAGEDGAPPDAGLDADADPDATTADDAATPDASADAGPVCVDEECNGADDDCDGAIDEGCDCADGDEQACYGGDPATRGVGTCADGTQECSEFAWGPCEGDVRPVDEECNGLDDDCDGEADEDDPGGGEACATGLDGPCADGVQKCLEGVLTCVSEFEIGLERCNGIDDDCDPATVDGVEDPELGEGCDGPDADRCVEGVQTCEDGRLACSDATAATPDLCNGEDDDCDPATGDGSADPAVGADCDGDDTDHCAEGTRTCVGGLLGCDDATGSTLDLCNGQDDDCDAASADGAEDPQVGALCDGGDTDHCAEGVRSCDTGALACSDATGSTLDVCNGQDDDCDAASADGAEDTQVGTLCDGADTDHCAEGSLACVGGGLSCSDTTGSTLDLCNGQDDDCDAASADGTEDPQLGASCDGADADQCLEGVRTCAGGALACSDATGSTAEVCAGDAANEDCDAAIDEGFPRDDNPACATGTFDLGFLSGDTGTGVLSDSYFNEEFDLVTITEDGDTPLYVSATVELWSPAGVDYDLYVYCLACGGTLAGSSTVHSLAGHTDVVELRVEDEPVVDDDFDVIIEVRHNDSNRCAYWELSVYGNTVVDTATCD